MALSVGWADTGDFTSEMCLLENIAMPVLFWLLKVSALVSGCLDGVAATLQELHSLLRRLSTPAAGEWETG